MAENLSIGGSVFINENISISGTGWSFIHLHSDSVREIKMNGSVIKKATLTFNGGGEWYLSDSLSLEEYSGVGNYNVIKVYNADFNSNGHQIRTGNFVVEDMATDVNINIKNSNIFLGRNSSYDKSWDIKGANVNLNASNSKIILNNSDITYDTGFRGGGNEYDAVIFHSSGEVSIGSNDTINILKLKSGNEYEFQQGDTLWILDKIELFDTSSDNTYLRSSDMSATAAISISSGNLCLNNADIKNLNAIGGASFTMGYGSNDLGGNSGWQSSANYCHAYIEGHVFDHNGGIFSAGWVILFNLSGGSIADTTDIIHLQNDGGYLFENIPLGNYLIMVQQDDTVNTHYPPLYYPGEVLWMDAQILNIMSDTTDFDMHMLNISPQPLGTGYIFGEVKEGVQLFRGPSDPIDSIVIGIKRPDISNDVYMLDTTDNDGIFEFKNLLPGKYVIYPDVVGILVDTSGWNNVIIGSGSDTSGMEFTVDSNMIYVSPFTDIKEYIDELKLWPNPVEDKFFVSLNERPIGFNSYDIYGKKIQIMPALSGGQVCFDVGDLPKGVYILEIMFKNKSSISKFLKL